MRLAVLPVLAVLVLALPAVAQAHELQFIPVGGAEIDAGRGDPARLVHATLDERGDQLVVSVRATGTPLELLLLTPDRRPERGFDGAALPTLTIDADNVAAPPGDSEVERGGMIVDEATAIEYRVLEAQTLAIPAGARVKLVVQRGDEPTRVALRVGPPTSFEAANVENTPRTLVRVRAWNDTPAPSSDYEPPPPKTTDRTLVAIYGAGIALLAIGVGAWWVRSGRRRSREQGVERAAAERRS